jgi:hypothetical protein
MATSRILTGSGARRAFIIFAITTTIGTMPITTTNFF